MPRANLISLFGEFARYAGDVAVVQRRGYRREVWSYAKLAHVAFACAHELRERGVRTGDRVLLWGPNGAEWMAAFWGCLLRGAVALPMDDGATVEFAGRVARETSAKLVIAARDKPLLDAVIPVLKLEDLADISKRPRVVVTQIIRGAPTKPMYESLADEPLTRAHIAQILFTSGTTAEPRGVVLTHGNFLANLEPLERGIDPYRKYEKWLHPLRFVSLVPISHVFGQFMALFVPPLLGATVVFEHSANPAEIVRTIKGERATALIAVPRMLDGLRAGVLRDLEARRESDGFSRTFAAANGEKFLRRAWRFRRMHRRFGWKFWAFISGGAALSGETEEFFKRMGYAVVQGYGMTETASLISLNHPFRAAQGSIGKVLPGREFRLAEDGEILVRGENVASGYWEAGALRPSEEQGWLRTGDVGELDAEGNLRFRGRKKNVIVTPAGLNVYPEDLEAALRKQAGVCDCVVVPFEHSGNAEPCAVLLMSDAGRAEARPYKRLDKRPDKEAASAGTERAGAAPDGGEAAACEAIKSANQSLAEYQRMRSWVVWPAADFPRTPTGKPRLALVTAAALRILGGLPGASTTGVASASRTDRFSGASTNRVEDLVEQFRAPADATHRAESDLNLSSLDRVELMSALEERYQVELNETAFAEAKTVGDVERLLREPSARRSEYLYPRWTQREPVHWFRLAIYYALVWPATQILGHPRIVGRENLRGVRGPVLIVSNHITRRADIGLILAALPSRFRHRVATAMGGETLQRMRHPPGDWFFAKRWAYQLGYWLATAQFNVFPLPQFSGFRESFRYAGECVDRGYSVLVFPEGEVNDSETGEMAKFRSGIGLLAENLRVPIVPMRLDGVWGMKRQRRRLARIGEITVRIGAPINFPHGTAADQIAETLESAVRSL
jgi:long-chain acyl-CoA synthetase